MKNIGVVKDGEVIALSPPVTNSTSTTNCLCNRSHILSV